PSTRHVRVGLRGGGGPTRGLDAAAGGRPRTPARVLDGGAGGARAVRATLPAVHGRGARQRAPGSAGAPAATRAAAVGGALGAPPGDRGARRVLTALGGTPPLRDPTRRGSCAARAAAADAPEPWRRRPGAGPAGARPRRHARPVARVAADPGPGAARGRRARHQGRGGGARSRRAALARTFGRDRGDGTQRAPRTPRGHPSFARRGLVRPRGSSAGGAVG